MAHFAELDENNIVIRVIVGIDESVGDGEIVYGVETKTIWKKTSYNTVGGVHLLGGEPFRKNYAGIGFRYDEVLDAFIPPQPFPSWILDKESCIWVAPIEKPKDDKFYSWSELDQKWSDSQ
jgi:hypothetical protein